MTYNGKELNFVADDGNGNRLWEDPDSSKVANESYDPETGESFGLDDDIEGWNLDPEKDCFLS